MTTKVSTDHVIELLAAHKTIGGAPREELVWLAEHGTLARYKQGEIVARRGELTMGPIIVFSGRFAIYMQRETGMRRMMEWGAGDISGLLPYSRMTGSPGDVVVEEPCEALKINPGLIPELIRNCYEVTAIMVHVMTDRARRFTSADLRDEKMISLGKLAAGFAHELNNPASAALRDASALSNSLGVAEEAARSLCTSGLTSAQLAELDALWAVTKSAPKHPAVSGLELADREELVEEWLSRHQLSESLAADIAGTPVAIADLDRLSAALAGAKLEAALRWLAAAMSARSLVLDIERATKRIHTLVSAAKGFTHMDRTPELESVEIAPGLEDTVALLEGKARSKSVSITVHIPDDLPPVHGYTAEINQIWMNLIDNAIGAAPEGGQVSVDATHEGADIVVSVIDNGSGIPPEIMDQIFDPFFTTKPVGEGSGLGLDIVRRVVRWHDGDVKVTSEKGKTEFRVRLPIGGAERKRAG